MQICTETTFHGEEEEEEGEEGRWTVFLSPGFDCGRKRGDDKEKPVGERQRGERGERRERRALQLYCSCLPWNKGLITGSVRNTTASRLTEMADGIAFKSV